MKSAASIAALLSFCLFACLIQAKAETAQNQFSSAFELLKAGKPKEAAAKFEAGLKADPKNALAHYYLGEAYSALNRNVDARKQYQASLDSDPASSVATNAKEKLAQLSAARAPVPNVESAATAKSSLSAEDTVAFINSRLQCEVAWTASNTPSLRRGLCDGTTRCEVDQSSRTKYVVSADKATVLIYQYAADREEDSVERDTENWHNKINKEMASVYRFRMSAVLADLTPDVAVTKSTNADGEETKFYSVGLTCRDGQACASSNTSNKWAVVRDDTTLFKSGTSNQHTEPTDEQKSALAAIKNAGLDPVAISKLLEVVKVKEETYSGIGLQTCDQDSAERIGRAFTHLIEISGGKKSKPLPF